MRGLNRVLVCVALLGVLGACAPATRGASALRATALGHMPPPEGSALVSEIYRAPFRTLEAEYRATYTRVFATNTPEQFARAVAEYARQNRFTVDTSFDKPLINTGPGYMTGAHAKGEIASVTLVFYDLDSASWRQQCQVTIDCGVWRYMAELTIWEL